MCRPVPLIVKNQSKTVICKQICQVSLSISKLLVPLVILIPIVLQCESSPANNLQSNFPLDASKIVQTNRLRNQFQRWTRVDANTNELIGMQENRANVQGQELKQTRGSQQQKQQQSINSAIIEPALTFSGRANSKLRKSRQINTYPTEPKTSRLPPTASIEQKIKSPEQNNSYNSILEDNLGDSELLSLLGKYFELHLDSSQDSNPTESLMKNTLDDSVLGKMPRNFGSDVAADKTLRSSIEIGSSNCTEPNDQVDCDKRPNSKATVVALPELPRPTNLSVIMLSHYPPILELRWTLNEPTSNLEWLVGSSSALATFDTLPSNDFYAKYDTNNDTTKESAKVVSSLDKQANINVNNGNHNNANEPFKNSVDDQLQTTSVYNGTSKTTIDTSLQEKQRMSLLNNMRIRSQLIKKSLTCFQVIYHVSNSR